MELVRQAGRGPETSSSAQFWIPRLPPENDEGGQAASAGMTFRHTNCFNEWRGRRVTSAGEIRRSMKKASFISAESRLKDAFDRNPLNPTSTSPAGKP
jgi:hypothetical protein